MTRADDDHPVLGHGDAAYRWIEGWADFSKAADSAKGWAHNGVVVTDGGEVVTFHPSQPVVLVYGHDGRLKRSWKSGLVDGHGMTLIGVGSAQSLWIADYGAKLGVDDSGAYVHEQRPHGQVVEFSLDGEEIRRLPTPPLPVYEVGAFRPTSVAVDEERFGGNGDIWVADGYGASLVHRYDRMGAYVGTVTGEHGAGAFSCPHAVFIDRRADHPRIYVADRGNRRVQVFDRDGEFQRLAAAGVWTSPSAFATYKDRMVVAELHARLVVLDIEDAVVACLGENPGAQERPGWPNAVDGEGAFRPADLIPGLFNSPHALAVDADGNLYVVEYLVGGRLTKLEADPRMMSRPSVEGRG